MPPFQTHVRIFDTLFPVQRTTACPLSIIIGRALKTLWQIPRLHVCRSNLPTFGIWPAFEKIKFPIADVVVDFLDTHSIVHPARF